MGSSAGPGRPARRPLRRVWLPRLLYEAMPWIYCGLGASALLSGLFLADPAWMAPYLRLLAVTGLHAGVGLFLLRRRYRLGRLRRQRQARAPTAGVSRAKP